MDERRCTVLLGVRLLPLSSCLLGVSDSLSQVHTRFTATPTCTPGSLLLTGLLPTPAARACFSRAAGSCSSGSRPPWGRAAACCGRGLEPPPDTLRLFDTAAAAALGGLGARDMSDPRDAAASLQVGDGIQCEGLVSMPCFGLITIAPAAYLFACWCRLLLLLAVLPATDGVRSPSPAAAVLLVRAVAGVTARTEEDCPGAIPVSDPSSPLRAASADRTWCS